MSEKFTLPSGAVLEVTPLPYEEAWGVAQVLVSEIGKLNVDLKGIDFTSLTAMDVLAFKNPICAIIASKEILDVVKAAFKRCTYNGQKITVDTFESSDSRADFLPVAFYVLKVNVSPFFGSLLSFFVTK